MNPINEIMLWYLAYVDRLNARTDEPHPRGLSPAHALPLRRLLARRCGQAALSVATWLLAEEARIAGDNPPETRHPTAASRP